MRTKDVRQRVVGARSGGISLEGHRMRPARRIMPALLVLAAAPGPAAMALDLEKLRKASRAHERGITSVTLTGLRSERNLTPAMVPATVARLAPRALDMAKANRSWEARERIALDVSLHRWRLERRDTRDLVALARELGPEVSANEISRSVTMIAGDKDYRLSYYPDGYALAVLDTPAERRPKGPVITGIIPAEMLSRATEVQVEPAQHEGRSCRRVTLRLGSTDAIYYADPAIGLRFRTSELTTSDGRLLRRLRLSDYRVTDEIPFPFLQVEQVFDRDGQLSRENTLKVESARFNVAIAAAEFTLTVPPGTAVSLFAGSAQKLFTSRQEVTLTLESALEVFESTTHLNPQ